MKIQESSFKVYTRERRADVMSRFLKVAKNIDVLHGRKIKDVLTNTDEVRKFISGLEESQFIGLLNGLNGILRGKKKSEWAMDGDSVFVEGILLPSEYIPPRMEDKIPLFIELLKKAKEMVEVNRPNEDIALLVGATINAVHAYADANGRTSRLAYVLLKDGLSSKYLEEVLSEEGRDVVDVNQSFVRTELEDIFLYKPLTNLETNPMNISGVFPDKKVEKEYEFKEDISYNLRSTFFKISRDSDYFRIAVLEHIYKTNQAEKYIATFPKLDLGQSGGDAAELPKKKRIAVVLSRLTPDLDQAAVESIITRYWELKKIYVELLMDSIVNPDKQEFKIEKDGRQSRIIDLFKLEVEKHSTFQV